MDPSSFFWFTAAFYKNTLGNFVVAALRSPEEDSLFDFVFEIKSGTVLQDPFNLPCILCPYSLCERVVVRYFAGALSRDV